MKAGTNTAGHDEYPVLFPEWEEAKELAKQWAGKTFTQGNLVQVGLAAATLALFGFLFYALAQGIRNYQVLGF
jgi:hypothetical protein